MSYDWVLTVSTIIDIEKYKQFTSKIGGMSVSSAIDLFIDLVIKGKINVDDYEESLQYARIEERSKDEY